MQNKPFNYSTGALHPVTGKPLKPSEYNELAKIHGWLEMEEWEVKLREKLENMSLPFSMFELGYNKKSWIEREVYIEKFYIRKLVQRYNQRRCGNTTRLADDYIQRLFKGETVKLVDHYPSKIANNILSFIVINRLKTEHPYTKFKVVDQNEFVEINLIPES